MLRDYLTELAQTSLSGAPFRVAKRQWNGNDAVKGSAAGKAREHLGILRDMIRVVSPIRVGAVLLFVMGLVAAATPSAFAGTTYGPNGPTNVNTNQQTISKAADLTTGIIQDRINQATTDAGFGTFSASAPTFAVGNGGGKAAGDEPKKIGFWGSLGNTWVRDTQTGVDFNGTILSGVAGVDYRALPWLLVGVAGGYEGTSINTNFNSGQQWSAGGVISVYGAARLAPSWSLSAQVGHGWLSYWETHGGVNGVFGGDRWFGAANINTGTNVDQWRLSGSLGYFFFTETQSGYSETNGNFVPSSTPYLGQIRLRGQAGYEFITDWGTIMPYVGARLEFDTSYSAAPIINSLGQRASYSWFGTTFSAGVKAKLGDRSSFILEGTTTQFRQYFEAYGINGSFRISF
jgi:hypothetical protein